MVVRRSAPMRSRHQRQDVGPRPAEHPGEQRGAEQARRGRARPGSASIGCAVLERDQHLVHQRHGQVGRHQRAAVEASVSRKPSSSWPCGRAGRSATAGTASRSTAASGLRAQTGHSSSPGSGACSAALLGGRLGAVLQFDGGQQLQRLGVGPACSASGPAATGRRPARGVPTPAWSRVAQLQTGRPQRARPRRPAAGPRVATTSMLG